MTLLAFKESRQQAEELARLLGESHAEVVVHKFPDGERRVTVPDIQDRRIIIYRSLNDPDHKLIELMLCADTLRQQGHTQLILVAPYLCYMRQDIAFHKGEAVSQKILGKWLASMFDTLITVDPHLHRISRLSDAVPVQHAITLTATSLLGEFVCQQLEKALLIGPDVESEQWVREVARVCGLEFLVAEKQRMNDNRVSVQLPEHDFNGRHVVLVDDMISTGHTMAETARQVRSAGAASVSCLATHGLFSKNAENLLKDSGVENIWTTDSIPHSSNVMSLASLLASAL